jgi:hypothetical protein
MCLKKREINVAMSNTFGFVDTVHAFCLKIRSINYNGLFKMFTKNLSSRRRDSFDTIERKIIGFTPGNIKVYEKHSNSSLYQQNG